MSVSTLSAAIIIVAGTVLLKLIEKEDKLEKERFENS